MHEAYCCLHCCPRTQAAQPYVLVGLLYCNLDTNTLGTYTVTYSVTGGSPSVTVSVSRTVVVQVGAVCLSVCLHIEPELLCAREGGGMLASWLCAKLC